MRNIIFTEDDRQARSPSRSPHPEPRVQRKVEVHWLQSHGLGPDQIGASADVSRRTVQRSLDEELEGRLQRLWRRREYPPRSALVEHEVSREEHFEADPVGSAKQARAVIEKRTGIRRGLTRVRPVLKDRPGLRGRRTGAIPVPPKKTIREHAREQSAFVRDKLEPRLEQARQGRRQGDFGDAAHFDFAPVLGCLGCAARLFVRAASGRKRHNVLGARNAVTHRLIRATNQGDINAESACEPLRSVAGAALGLPITRVPDNARYQKCAVVQTRAATWGIELLYLPSDSPNLNLIERLWRFVGMESLNSTDYEKFEDFRTAIDEGLDGLGTVHRGEMETLMTHRFQLFDDVPLLAA
jgi:hypothetical protein